MSKNLIWLFVILVLAILFIVISSIMVGYSLYECEYMVINLRTGEAIEAHSGKQLNGCFSSYQDGDLYYKLTKITRKKQ